MALTDIDIVNLALGKIKSGKITALADKEFINLENLYSQLRDRLLTLYNWNFARTRIYLTPKKYTANTIAFINSNQAGVIWTERANPKNIALSGIVWTGSIFCAVGENDGTDAYILTSPNGEVWTEQTVAVPKNISLRAIVWNGSVFCAVGENDGTDAYIVTSPDGVIWTERANPKNIHLFGITWNGAMFCAVGENDGTDAYILTSPNGENWTERANPKNISLRAIVWNGSVFCAVGYDDGTDAYILTSPNGENWTERANPKNIRLYGITWDGSVFCAVGEDDGVDAYILTSPNGEVWTEQTVAVPKNIGLWGITWNGAMFCAVGNADGVDAYILTSLTSPDTITNSNNKFITDGGFRDGDKVAVTGSASNNGTLIIVTVAAGILTLLSTDVLIAESAGVFVTLERKPAFEYNYCFQLPSNYLGNPELDSSASNFEVEDGYIFCNDYELNLIYTKQVTDPTKFPALFIECLVLTLASELAITIANDRVLRNDIFFELQTKLLNSFKLDAYENKSEKIEDTTWQKAGR